MINTIDSRKDKLSVSITLILLLVSFFFVFLFYFLAKPWVCITLAFVDVIFLSFYLLGKRGYSWPPKAGTLILGNIATYFFSSVLGIQSEIYILFFSFVAVPLIVFETKEYLSRWFLVGMPLLGYVLVKLLKVNPFFSDPLNAYQAQFVHIGVVIASFGILILVMQFLMTENKRAEDTLIEMNTQLQQSNNSLEIAYQNLENSNSIVQSLGQKATLGAILRGIMHEVKGPLTSIRACCNLVLMKKDLNPDIKKNVERMLEYIVNLSELIKTLLADAGSVAWTDAPLPLDRIIDQVLKLVDNEGFLKKIKLEKSIPSQLPVVKGTGAYVSQALLNLLLNALRFSPENSSIKVIVKVDIPWVKIYVIDSGPGIDPAIKDNLFEQGVTTATPGEGSHVGLGLHFVKRVMKAHKGSIAVFNSSPKGSTFVMALPISNPISN
jgi:signal transduction histidine kinase